MTDKPTDTTSSSGEKKVKHPLLKRRWVSFQLDGIGLVQVEQLSIKGLTEVLDLADLSKPNSLIGEALVIGLMKIVVALPLPGKSEDDIRRLTEEEASSLASESIKKFAAFFMKMQGQGEVSDSADEKDPIASVVEWLRLEDEKWKKTMEGLQSHFSGPLPSSIRPLIAKNFVLSDQLKGLGASLPSVQMRAVPPAEISSTVSASEIALKNLTANSHSVRIAKAGIELNQKMEEVLETSKIQARCQGQISENLTQILGELGIQRQADEVSRKNDAVAMNANFKLSADNLKIAKWALIASVVIGMISLWFSCESFRFTKNNAISGEAHQVQSDQLQSDQAQAIQELVSLQHAQNKIQNENFLLSKNTAIAESKRQSESKQLQAKRYQLQVEQFKALQELLSLQRAQNEKLQEEIELLKSEVQQSEEDQP